MQHIIVYVFKSVTFFKIHNLWFVIKNFPMKKISIVFIGISLLFNVSCDKKVVSGKEEKNGAQLVSNTYKKPVFLNDMRIEKIKGITDTLQQLFNQHASEKNIPGIAYGIVVDDTLVLSSTIGVSNIDSNTPVQSNTAFRIASMTKSFTAMAILKLRDEGLLSLTDPVMKYIPELEKLNYLTSDSPVINIENLLTMTAGFPEDNPWGDRQLAMSNEDFMTLMANGLSISKVPSYQYEYSNTGYAMLGYIITQVSGQSYQDYITKNILHPLDMHHTFWEYDKVPKVQLANGYRWEDEQWKPEPILHDGAYGAMGGLITSIDDFSKYVSFHLSAWPARSDKEKEPLKRSSVREMHTPKYNFLNSWNKDWNNEPCASMIGYGYGLGIAMDCKRITRVSHGGALPGFGSNFAFFPKYGIGLMAFGNLTYTRPIPYDKIEKMIFETLEVKKRSLPVSDILKQRKKEITKLIKDEEVRLDSVIFAENFFLDKSKEKRIKEIKDILNKAGTFKKVLEISPRNQLRGSFKIQCENGDIRIFFTLTPEKIPLVQKLNLSFKASTSR